MPPEKSINSTSYFYNMAMKKKVVVAMSGGVDSSVAAALLKNKGYDVTGITMCFNLPDDISGRPRCCGAQGISDAKRVADILGVRHYVLNFGQEMQKKVIADFIRQYSRGYTPNPCVRCNEFIKFDGLFKRALGLGADYLATGHYARIVKHGNKYYLKKAKDLKKDQSYFLYRLAQDKLGRILFPLGSLIKDEVRQLAERFKLPVAQKKESQEICFIPANYQDFLKSKLKGKFFPGNIVDAEGNIIGRHKGIPFYTIGQRDKLGIARGYPVYISRIDPRNNAIIVGRKEELLKQRFLVGDTIFACAPDKKRILLDVKIRYLSPDSSAWVTAREGKAEVDFKIPQFAITPGQSAVFYCDDRVVGGGIIEEVLE